MQIYAYTQPYKKMRYPTMGDYLYHLKQGWFKVTIAETGNIDYDMAIFIHEIKEAYLCWKAGIKENDITAFDIMFENERKASLHKENDEPGDDPRCIYRKEHQLATQDEKKFIKDTGNTWKKYCKTLNEVEDK